ncbi:MAG: NuoI/complex I 23 kDa subunit family protein [Armatimonadota bacterium]
MSVLAQIADGAKSILKGLRVTLGYLFSKKVTLQYPEERPRLSERFRGVPALPIDPATGRDRCIACSACARVCPDQVITVVAEVGEDKKRHLADMTLDVAGCIFCGLCVEVCPTGALVLSDEFELAHSSREDLVLGLDKLHEIGGQFPEKPAEPQEGTEGQGAAQGTPAPAEAGKEPEA